MPITFLPASNGQPSSSAPISQQVSIENLPNLEDDFEITLNEPIFIGGEGKILSAIHKNKTTDNRFVVKVAIDDYSEANIRNESKILQ